MLRKRLIILNTTVLFLLTMIFVGMNLSTTKKIVENEVYGTLNAQMNDGAAELADTFESARNLALELCAADSIQYILRAAYSGELDPVEALAQANDYAKDKGRLFSYFHTDMVVMTQNGTQYFMDDVGDEVEVRRRGDDGYREKELDGDFEWDFFYTDYGAYVRVSHVIYDSEDWGRVMGIASVSINRDFLLYTLNSMWMGDGGIVYLMDEGGGLLFPYADNARFPQELGTQEPLREGNALRQTLFFKRDIGVNGYSMIGVAKNIDTLKQMASQRQSILLIALAVLGTATVITFGITYRISGPILKLAEMMKTVEQGNFELEIPALPRRGEITILYDNFRQMLKMRKSLIEEIYGARVREKEAELRALQAQINPHFLYNTLDSINWMAVKYGADDIEEVVTELSRMLRYSLNNGMNILKISEELTQIKAYIKIQQIRFSDSFSADYEVDPEVLDHRIIKLLLQPLVENALLHGFDEAGQKGLVIIRVRHLQDRIEFSVINNGKKMDLEKMALALNQPEEEKSASYGLRNVNDRLIKFYGTESSLKFRVEGEFSIAGFSIPFTEGESL